MVEYQYSESAKTALHQLHGTALKNGYVLKVRPWEDPKVTQQAGKRQAVKTDEVQRKVNPSMATPGKRQKSTTRWADKVVLVDFEQDNAQMKRALSPTLWSIGEKADIAGSVHECKRYRNERINVRTTGNSSTTPSTTRSNADKQIASLLEEESDFLKQSRAVPNALERVKGSSLKNRLFITCNSKVCTNTTIQLEFTGVSIRCKSCQLCLAPTGRLKPSAWFVVMESCKRWHMSLMIKLL